MATGIMNSLHHEFEFHHFMLNRRDLRGERPWERYANQVPGDPDGRTQIPALLASLQPDAVLFFHDYWLYCAHFPAIERCRPRPRTVVYCPVDGPLSQPGLLSPLRSADRIIAYSRFGRAELQRALSRSDIAVIPHSIDTEAFRPLGDVAKARRLLYGPDLEDAFIVLNGNRHSVRKRLGLTIEGFALFAAGKPRNVKLHLHSGIPPRTLADHDRYLRLRRDGRILHTDPRSHEFPDVSDRRLNVVYNACDAGVNTASAEGFGLVSFEHAATGAPQIIPGHPGCRELWHEKAMFVPPVQADDIPGDYIAHKLVAPTAVAAALEELYADPAGRAKRGSLDQTHARRRALHVSETATAWRHVLHALLDQRQ
ncbi:hypothetical protein E1264_22785 [Actinomadura sp. KC216]|uniref:glycosyltransferase family 4 protein n=1 Tax=Actinomadura sp. KC216 TaxID=2530370 RepID=UPI001046A3CE|nr:glycosyltransferase family 4 protein [Actinomadura sp. KC216]TDB84985.1 hypothetical protein E1264_22785 [Actinomadura sp. KC216]